MTNNKAAWILAFGLIIASVVFGLFFYYSRQGTQTIRVVGYSTKEYEADIVKWRFSFSEVVPLGSLAEGYEKMNRKLADFKAVWGSEGISFEEMNIQPISIRKNYGQYGTITGNTLERSMYIVSKDVDAVEKIAVDPINFVKKGIAFEYSNMEYYSSELPKMKKELLGLATKNALERANEIARSVGSSVVGIRSARAGVFQITEPYSTDVSDYGVYQTSTRKKNIRVTVSGVFAIK